MELRQLRYFLEICEHGAFSKAAEKIFVAQSALSHQIGQLESELRTSLFHRSRRGIVLTEAGKIFRTHAISILRQVEDARASVESVRDMPAGKVILGIPQSASSALALPILKAIQAELPRVDLELSEELTGNLSRQLIDGSIHLAILFENRRLGDFIVEPLARERLYLVCRPDLLKHKMKLGTCFRNAIREPLILPATPHGVRPIIDSIAAAQGLPAPNVIADISSISILKTSLLAGMGSSIVPRIAMKAEIEAGQLVTVPVRTPQIARDVVLCRAPQFPLSTATRAVANIVGRVARELCTTRFWPDARPLAASE